MTSAKPILQGAKAPQERRLRFFSLIRFVLPIIGLQFAISSPALGAQKAAPALSAIVTPSTPPDHWVQAAAANEIHIIEQNGTLPLRYTVHKIDAKGDVEREVIETSQGSVARLVKKNGQPLSAEEDAAERDRLKEILQSPEDWLKRHKRDDSVREYSMNLVRLMPQAMLYSYAPGQPQAEGTPRKQIVIDYKPDPKFHPPNMLSDLLTGLTGRMWIDAQSQRLTRIEGRVLRPVNFGFGIVARIYPGGTIEFEQQNVADNNWVYSEVTEHLKLREMMVKTAEENTQMRAYNFRMLPAPMTVQEAVNTLLAMPVPLR